MPGSADLPGQPGVTILHASDLHFGKPHRPAAAEALLRLARAVRPAAIVVSGDLTQRAKVREYRAARAFLARLDPTPVVVTAGNHDVPLYRAWERLFAPYRNYRTYIARQLDTILDIAGEGDRPGLRFVALNSSSPRRAIVNGRLTGRQLGFATAAFAGIPGTWKRVLVVHHNLVDTGDDDPIPPLPRAPHILRRAEEWRVDLILTGHIHRTHLAWSHDELAPDPRRGVPVVVAGTASSTRGRGREAGRNSVNVVNMRRSGIEVTVYLYSERAERFQPHESRDFRARLYGGHDIK